MILMRQQMSQMLSYTAAMEERNQSLAEQVQALVGALGGQVSVADKLQDSPQQLIKNSCFPVKREADGSGNHPSKRRLGRSRSPPKAAPVEVVESQREDPIDPTELKDLLGHLSEEMQLWVLNQKNSAPQRFVDKSAMLKLVEEASSRDAAKAAANNVDPTSKALAPFGKIPKVKGPVAAVPYRLPLVSAESDPYLTMTPPKELPTQKTWGLGSLMD